MANPIVEAFITTHTVHYYDDALMEIKDVRALIAQLIPADSVLVPRNTCEYMLGVVEGRIAAVDRYPESPAVREAKDHCTKFRQAIGYPVGTWLPNPGPAAEPKCFTCDGKKKIGECHSECHAGCDYACAHAKPCPDCVGAQPEGVKAICACDEAGGPVCSEKFQPHTDTDVCSNNVLREDLNDYQCGHSAACHAEPSTTKGERDEPR